MRFAVFFYKIGAMNALEVSNLQKSYHKIPVLRNLNLAIAQGEFFGFAGVNGAGKSTFLKCMLDFCHYEAGTIKIFGVSSKERRARARLAFLPERFTPPYYLTGEEFLRFILKLRGAAYNPARAEEMLDNLDLAQSALRKPTRSFSKGMTQKLGLAGCFLSESDFYILDEPMSGLDPKARALVKREFNRLRERGATLFFTSHALADVDEVCSRMAVLHQGKICFAGSPAQMREQYASAPSLEEAYLQAIAEEAPESPA